jgi:hypothetical protein
MKRSILARKRTSEINFASLALALVTAALACAPSARANIYATNIRVNGSLTPVATPPGQPVSISYVLNEPATAGVTLQILQGTTAVRTFTFNPDLPGASRGTNAVVWDGTDDNGVGVPFVTYSVRITARSNGYTNWTQLTDDANPGNYVWEGQGIAVDRNSASPYYGRVFISSASLGPNPAGNPGDNIGILKLNADGSFADPGGITTGGHSWSGSSFSPWRLEVSDDDYVYVNDWSASGEIYRWDPTLSSSSLLQVLGVANYDPTTTLSYSGPAIWGTGTNTSVWMANTIIPSTLGLVKFAVTNDGTVASNNFGVNVVAPGGDLTSPFDLALDKAGNIYTVQFADDPADPMPRVLQFAAYDPSTNGGMAETTAMWAIGQTNANQAGASGIAVDPTGTYLAVAFMGSSLAGGRTNGNTQILSAATGALLVSLDLGVILNNQTNHVDTDCSWDAVGNVYYIDNLGAADGNGGVWRAFSPPGTNQTTMVAVATVALGGASTVPFISNISWSPAGDTVTVNFNAATNDLASAFTLLSAGDPAGPYTSTPGAAISGSAGVFQATAPAGDSMQFYRIQR